MTQQNSSLQYYLVSVGTLVNVSAYVGILVLQSSMNITDNLGTISASILYACALVLLLLFTPYMLTEVGPKWSLVLGEIGFFVYTLGNFFPTFYTMIPTAVVGSLGEALVWSSSTLYVAQMVKSHWSSKGGSKEDAKGLDSIRNKWFGHFFAILKSCQIIGNLLSYAVLYGARNLNVGTTNATYKDFNLSLCGSRYCLSEHADSDRYKYVPKSKISIYLLVGIYAAMQAFAVILHSVFLERLPRSSNESILVTPTGLYYGLVVGYAASNFTQAFVSCTIGVQQVGLVMVIYGVLNVVTSFLVGRLAHRFSLRPVFVCGFVYDVFSWTVQLLWRPTQATEYWVYAIGGLIGVSDGIWQTASASATGVFFSDRVEVAFGNLSFCTVLGLFISFLISGKICVNANIGLLYFVLTCVTLGYSFAEWRRCKNRQESESEERTNMLEYTDQSVSYD